MDFPVFSSERVLACEEERNALTGIWHLIRHLLPFLSVAHRLWVSGQACPYCYFWSGAGSSETVTLTGAVQKEAGYVVMKAGGSDRCYPTSVSLEG